MTLLITGGSSGIGLATAQHFARQGWHVYELSRHGVSADGIVHLDGDVTSVTDCQRAVATVLERERALVGEAAGIDVLISNAGMGIAGPIELTSDQEAHQQMEVNFFGAMNILRTVLPEMRSRRRGRILFVSSLTAIFPIPYQSYYSASKAALNAMALALRNEVRPYGITVGCLLPGDVRTGFTAARRSTSCDAVLYPHARRSIAIMERDEQRGISPEQVARQLWHMANARYLSIYHITSWPYRLLNVLQRLLPKTLVNRVVGEMY